MTEKKLPLEEKLRDEEVNMCLAAISVACMCNTEASAKKQKLKRGSKYATAAYWDVVHAVEREIFLRKKILEIKKIIDDSLLPHWIDYKKNKVVMGKKP